MSAGVSAVGPASEAGQTHALRAAAGLLRARADATEAELPQAPLHQTQKTKNQLHAFRRHPGRHHTTR